MKGKEKILGIICSFLMLFSVFGGNIKAEATPYFAAKYSQGVGNVTICVDNASGASYWETYIVKGADNWMYPGSGMSNPIYIKFVSSTYGSKMDFYCRKNSYWTSQGEYNVRAETEYYDDKDGLFDPMFDVGNYYSAKILINDDHFRMDSFTNEQAQGTIIHEMGHAFGLAHNYTNQYSIMCQGDTRKVERVQKVDNDAINLKYN